MKFINIRHSFLGLFVMSFLAACQPIAVEEEPDMKPSCNSEEFEHLLWQPESVLETMKFGSNVRIIRPGMAVTMDFRPDRLNIGIGESGRIERVYCG